MPLTPLCLIYLNSQILQLSNNNNNIDIDLFIQKVTQNRFKNKSTSKNRTKSRDNQTFLYVLLNVDNFVQSQELDDNENKNKDYTIN